MIGPLSWIEWMIITAIVTIGLYLGGIVYTEVTSQAACLSAGYPKVEVTWNLKAYCVTLDKASAVVVPR